MSSYIAFRNGGGQTDEQGALKFLIHLFRSGVAAGWAVTQRGSGANMSVDLSIGGASIPNVAGTYDYYGWTDAVTNVSVATANATNPRIDTLVAYVDLSVLVSANVNNVGALKFMVVTGTAAASPTAPNATAIQTAIGASNPYITLANIAVAANAGSILTANITATALPMALAVPYLYGGANNTKGHLVPNVADGTLALLEAAETITGLKTFSTNPVFNDAAFNPSILQDSSDRIADHIVAGTGVVALSSGLTGTFSNITYYIAGKRYTKTGIANNTYAASSDTYVDINAAGNITYTAVANNAASPSLASGYIRVAIVVTNGSAITSVNQGSTAATAPTVGGSALMVCDSLGNLIYNTNPAPTMLGYRQITTSSGGLANNVAVTGLGLTVIIPSGRKAVIKAWAQAVSGSASGFGYGLEIWDGVVNSGTLLSWGQITAATNGAYVPAYTEAKVTASGSKTYNVGVSVGSGTGNVIAVSTAPAFISVELI